METYEFMSVCIKYTINVHTKMIKTPTEYKVVKQMVTFGNGGWEMEMGRDGRGFLFHLGVFLFPFFKLKISQVYMTKY